MFLRSQRGFWTAYVLGGLTVLATVVLLNGLLAPPAAFGQVPDSGAQRAEMIGELKTSNQKLAEIAGLLREIRDLQRVEKKERESRPPGEGRP